MSMMSMKELAELRSEHKFNPDPTCTYTLPQHYYTDPEIYAREKEEIFYKTWNYAGALEHLSEIGDYITCNVADQGIFVIRAKDNELHAYYNVCQHRAAELVQGRGNSKKLLICPYHSWTYDSLGNLVTAPGTEIMEGFDREVFCLTEVRVEQFCNLVFVNLDPDAKTLKSQASLLEDEYYHFVPELDDLKFCHRFTWDVKSNWKIFAENFAECYHCPTVHQGLKEVVDLSALRMYSYDIHTTMIAPDLGFDEGALDPDNDNPLKKSNDEIQVGLFDNLWPNTAFAIWPGTTNFQVVTAVPYSAEGHIEHWDCFYRTNPCTERELEFMRFVGEQVQEAEDIPTLESVQRNQHSRGYKQGRYVVDKKGGTTAQTEHCEHFLCTLLLNALEGVPRIPLQENVPHYKNLRGKLKSSAR